LCRERDRWSDDEERDDEQKRDAVSGTPPEINVTAAIA
jgi:hypothetical protein